MTKMASIRTAIILILACASSIAAAGTPHFAADRPLDMEHIKLDLKVDLKAKTVVGRATLDMTALRNVSSILLDAVDFETHDVRVQIDGTSPVSCDFENDGKHLDLTLPGELKSGQKITVSIDYKLSDPTSGLSFFAPTEEEPDAPYVVWSQGQTVTNRYWVPSFDHPNELQTTEVTCTAARPYTVVSNGRLVDTIENDDGTRTFHWLQDKPHAVYLMTLVVGEFVSKTETWRGRPVTYHVRPKFKDRIHNSFGNTLAMLDFFSDRIGVEYPWAKYDQVCCYQFGGGMENTSATTLGERTLHDDRAHLDVSSDGLVAHELAHQWFGDLLTCREWAHTWLNEGFASYFEALWAEHHDGPDEFAYNLFRKAKRAIRGGKDKPIVHRSYERTWEQFDARAYPKGAWVLHMIRTRLDDDLFWKCIKTYTRRHAHQPVETINLRRAIEDVTGRSFERFFYDWTERPGHPMVTVKYKWLADRNLASVNVKQTQESDAFHFPLRLEFFGDSGPAIVSHVIDITDKDASLLLPLAKRPSWIRVDPGSTVLMELTEKKPRDHWVRQLEDDPDVVARIRAAEHFGETDSEQDRELLSTRLGEESFWAVQKAIATTLGKAGGDTARDALLANIKTAHPKARAAVVKALGSIEDEPDVRSDLHDLIEQGDASYLVEAAAIEAYAGLRPEGAATFLRTLLDRDSHNDSIRSAVLTGLGIQRDAGALDLLIDWSRTGKPMRCRSSAVEAIASVLVETDVSDSNRAEAIDAVVACVKSRSRWLPRAAMSALGDLGSDARAALTAIDAIAERPDSRLTSLAKRTAKRIRDGAKPSAQLAELREAVKDLQDENKELTKRLEMLEAANASDTQEPTDRATTDSEVAKGAAGSGAAGR